MNHLCTVYSIKWTVHKIRHYSSEMKPQVLHLLCIHYKEQRNEYKRGNTTLKLIKVLPHVEFDIISKKGVSNIFFYWIMLDQRNDWCWIFKICTKLLSPYVAIRKLISRNEKTLSIKNTQPNN